jgi:hypothetical protein
MVTDPWALVAKFQPLSLTQSSLCYLARRGWIVKVIGKNVALVADAQLVSRFFIMTPNRRIFFRETTHPLYPAKAFDGCNISKELIDAPTKVGFNLEHGNK